jgi:hypothetical protein
MTITSIDIARYTLDVGSIHGTFACSDGSSHSFTAVQDMFPTRPQDSLQRCDIVLGEIVLTEAPVLEDLRDAFRGFLQGDRRVPGSRAMPEDTLVLSDDISELMSNDETGSEQLMVRWICERIDRRIADPARLGDGWYDLSPRRRHWTGFEICVLI